MKQYKKIEEKWAAALKETPPKEVTVAVDIIYSGNDMRPDKFIVNYFIFAPEPIKLFGSFVEQVVNLTF
ncbi:hypothetical protein BTH41_01676 [Bacillus mycoides]|nr:hypothetical protein BTH41_01676 [Bacillus mycoides]